MKTAKKRGRQSKPRNKVQENLGEPTQIEVVAQSACRNPTMLRARHKDEMVIVKAPKRLRDKLIGKRIMVQFILNEAGEPTYEYIRYE